MTVLVVFGERIPRAERVAERKFRSCPWQFFDGVPDRCPDQLVWGDFAITRVMNSGIHEGIVPELPNRSANRALRRIANDLDIATAQDDRLVFDDVRRLFSAMRAHRISMSRSAKVLARKRPRLIPMLDSVVTTFLWEVAKGWMTGARQGKPSWFDTSWNSWTDGEDPTVYLQMTREAVVSARPQLEQIRTHVAQVSETGVPADAPLLRIWEATLFWHRYAPLVQGGAAPVP